MSKTAKISKRWCCQYVSFCWAILHFSDRVISSFLPYCCLAFFGAATYMCLCWCNFCDVEKKLGAVAKQKFWGYNKVKTRLGHCKNLVWGMFPHSVGWILCGGGGGCSVVVVVVVCFWYFLPMITLETGPVIHKTKVVIFSCVCFADVWMFSVMSLLCATEIRSNYRVSSARLLVYSPFIISVLLLSDRWSLLWSRFHATFSCTSRKSQHFSLIYV